MTFTSPLGDALTVVREGDRFAMDFPAGRLNQTRSRRNRTGSRRRAQRDPCVPRRFAVYSDAAQVRALTPDMAAVAALDFLGIIATAPGDDCDFVSRFFGPVPGCPKTRSQGPPTAL